MEAVNVACEHNQSDRVLEPILFSNVYHGEPASLQIYDFQTSSVKKIESTLHEYNNYM